MAAMKPALLVAETLAILCPHCNEPQPAPDNGSDAWMPAQVKAAEGKRTCVSCDEPFRLSAQSRVQVLP